MAQPEQPAPDVPPRPGHLVTPVGSRPTVVPERVGDVRLPHGAIGDCEVLEEIDRNARRVVLEARHRRLNRPVLVVLFLGPGPQTRERLRREAAALAKLRHENVISVIEHGEHEGNPFVVLEYHEGISLEQYLRCGPLTPQSAAALVAVLARAVHAAHVAGVLHRGLDPSVIILCKIDSPSFTMDHQPSESRRWALDFELVPLLTGFGPGADRESPFAAPEQLYGRGRIVDARTDVHALGAILYTCLTGRPPYQGATPGDTARLIRTQEPEPPRVLRQKTPHALETICLKCLGKRRGWRYRTALELAEDLERYLRGRPVCARRPGLVASSWRWCLDHFIAATLLLVLVLVAGGMTFIATQSARNMTTAERQVDRTRTEVDQQRQKVTDAESRRKEAERSLYVSRLQLAQEVLQKGDASWARRHLDLTSADTRGWELDYLANRIDAPQRTFLGHVQEVWAVAFSPDGSRVYSGGADTVVRAWDARTGREVLALRGHTKHVSSIAASPDGGTIITGSHDGTLILWDASTGRARKTLPGHTGGVVGLAVSADGSTIGSAGNDGRVRLWSTRTGRELHALAGHKGFVSAVAFSPDGGTVVSAGNDGDIRAWNVRDGKLQRVVGGNLGSIWTVAISPDGKHVAAAGGSPLIKVWDAQTGREEQTLRGHQSSVYSIGYSPDGRRLASASADNTIKVWDTRSGTELIALPGHCHGVTSVRFSPDGRRLVSGSQDCTVKVWDAARDHEGLVLRGHQGSIARVCASPDGKLIASAGADGTVRIWDVRTGRELHVLEAHSDGAHGVCFSPDSQHIASAGENGIVRIWDAGTGAGLQTLIGHRGIVLSVGYSPDGNRIVSGSDDATVKVWDARTGQELLTLRGHTDQVNAVNFSPDGKRIVSASDDRSAKVWDASTGKEMSALQGHTAGIADAQFTPDGTSLFTVSPDRGGRYWDIAAGMFVRGFSQAGGLARAGCTSPDGKRVVLTAGTHLHVWETTDGTFVLALAGAGNTSRFTSVCFTPDGHRLIAGSEDGTVLVWEGAESRGTVLRGHPSWVTGATFSPDGGRVATASRDLTVRMWNAATGAEMWCGLTHDDAVTCVGFDPTGRDLVTGSADHTVRVWDAVNGTEQMVLRGHRERVTSVGYTANGLRIVSVDAGGTRIDWDPTTGQQFPRAEGTALAERRDSPDGSLFAHIEGANVRLVPQQVGGERPVLAALARPDPDWHAEQVRASETDGDWFAASFHLARLIPLRPWDLSLHARLAHALRRQGRHTEAARCYAQGLLLAPQASPWPLDWTAQWRGWKAAEDDRWEDAVEDFRQAIHQPHAEIDAWQGLLLAQRMTRRDDDARQVCRAMLDRFRFFDEEFEPAPREVLLAVLCAPGEAGDTRLVKLAERVMVGKPAPADQALLGAAYYRAGQLDEAERTLAEAVKGAKDNADARVFMAMVRARQGRHEEAAALLEWHDDWLKKRPNAFRHESIRGRVLYAEAKALLAKPHRPE